MISGTTTLDRARGIPDLRVQVADDLQPVVREERHRRGCRADGCQTGGVPGDLPAAVQDDQHPRGAGDDAAQGGHHRAGRRVDADRPGGRCRQRGAGARRRFAARRSVRRRRLRPRRCPQGFRRRRASAHWWSATAASARRSRPRWSADGLARHRPVRPVHRGVRGARRTDRASTTPTSRSPSGPRIRTATTWW